MNVPRPEGQGTGRVSGVEFERRRGRLDPFLDHGRVKLDQVAIGPDVGPGVFEDGLGVFAQKLHADFAQDPQGRLMDHVNLISGQGFDGPYRVERSTPRALLYR